MNAPAKEIVCLAYCDTVASTSAGVTARRNDCEDLEYRRTVRFQGLWQKSMESHGSRFVKWTGDGFLVTFCDPLHALRAVITARQQMDADPLCQDWLLRAGIHVGVVASLPDGDLIGAEVAMAQRVMNCAGSRQIFLSADCAHQIERYLPEGCTLHDLGERAGKGFESPLRLYQLRAPGWMEAAAPTASLTMHSLPARLDAFIGRKVELADLRSLLARPEVRGITITGTAGSGKTRLGIQAALDARSRFPVVVFVPLEEATDADGVLARIAAALSLTLPPGALPLPRIQSALASQQALLLLDNFEQALEAAPALTALLHGLPLLKICVTSREQVAYEGETLYDLDPLPVPTPKSGLNAIRSADSVRLLAERARTVNRRFQLRRENAETVAELCRTLEGLPLALEIVAAETRYRPLEILQAELRSELLDLEARLPHLPPRQRTLRATFDWSCRLLEDEERTLFAQLSLFETAFCENMASEVCTVTDIRKKLRRLLDKGLLCQNSKTADRPYRMLVPVREYARMLLGNPDLAVCQRFLAAFQNRAQRLKEQYEQQADAATLHSAQRDIDNYRAAWNLARTMPAPGQALADLGMAVFYFAPLMPRAPALETWLKETQNSLERQQDIYRLGKLFNARARIAKNQGDFSEAVEYQRRSLHCLERAGKPAEIADAHSTLAMFALRASDEETAENHARLGLALAREACAINAEALSLCILASVQKRQEPEQAFAWAERSLSLFGSQKDRTGMAHACLVLADIAELQGQGEKAEAHCLEALRICWNLGLIVSVARCLEVLARYEERRQRPAARDALLHAAACAYRTHGGATDASIPADEAASTLARVVNRLMDDA